MTQEINIKKKTKNEIKSKRAWEERELPNCDLWEGGLIVEHHLISFKMCLLPVKMHQ